MAGIVVQNTVVNPGGEPYARGLVHIELVTGTDNGAGYITAESIIDRFTTTTDATGAWTATLQSNASITPANTYYRVTEGSAVSLITVPASGGPYALPSILATPPPTPSAPGITGVQVAVGGTVAGVRPEVNLIAGTNVTLNGADNPANSRVDVTINVPSVFEAWQFYVGAYGAKGDGVTDDTAAINRAVTAAGNYMATHGYAEVVFDPLTYLLAGAPTTGGTTNGSAQIPLPVVAQTAQKGILVFRGTLDQSALYHWLQTTPQRAGTILYSTYNGGNTLPATGEVSVIGGPTPHFMGDPPSTWDNLLVVIDGITIELANPDNMCGFDFRCVAEANVINAAVLGSITGTGAPAVPSANWGFGLAMPVANNNDNCNIGWYSVEGLVYGLIVYEHVQADSIRIINCFDGLVCWSSSGFPHHNTIDYASIEGCQRSIVFAGGFNKLHIRTCDIEWGGSYIIDDVGASPAIGRIGLGSNGGDGTSLNNALNSGPNAVNVANGSLGLEITNLDQALGPVGPPAVPASGAAFTNPYWRAAEVKISGGTVSQIAIDGVNQLLTSGTHTVPPGHKITLTYTVAPSWAWTLKG